MLVLSRKEEEAINIGDNIVITIVRICGNSVRIGIQAPENVLILREEVRERIERQKEKEVREENDG